MMITIVLLFTICWAPFHTVHMLFEYCKCCSDLFSEVVFDVICLFNSSLYIVLICLFIR